VNDDDKLIYYSANRGRNKIILQQNDTSFSLDQILVIRILVESFTASRRNENDENGQTKRFLSNQKVNKILKPKENGFDLIPISLSNQIYQ
jgi:hypothetical protein